jgi:hypothetical protein
VCVPSIAAGPDTSGYSDSSLTEPGQRVHLCADDGDSRACDITPPSGIQSPGTGRHSLPAWRH